MAHDRDDAVIRLLLDVIEADVTGYRANAVLIGIAELLAQRMPAVDRCRTVEAFRSAGDRLEHDLLAEARGPRVSVGRSGSE